MKPLNLDGIKYTKQYVIGLKQPLLDVRDILLEQGHMPHALSLTELHALLNYYVEQVEE